MASHRLTPTTFAKLKDEHFDLTTRGRIELAQKIEAARLLGDLSENGDYHAAKDEQGHMEGRIRQLEHLIENAEIIEAAEAGTVGPGSVVTVVYDGDSDDMAETYLLGHPEEVHPDGHTVMTLASPLGAALRGKREGEEAEYLVNNNTLKVKILKVVNAS